MSPADDEVEVQAEASLVRYQLSRRGIAVAALVGGAVLGLVGGATAMLVPLGGLAQEIAAMQLENAGLRRDAAAQTEMNRPEAFFRREGASVPSALSSRGSASLRQPRWPCRQPSRCRLSRARHTESRLPRCWRRFAKRRGKVLDLILWCLSARAWCSRSRKGVRLEKAPLPVGRLAWPAGAAALGA